MSNSDEFLKKIQPFIEQKETLRMKITLFSEDGKNWVVMRQHYISTAEEGFMNGVYILGAKMTLQTNNDMKEMNDEGQKKEEGQIDK